MNGSFSRQRVATIVAVALLGLAWLAPGARAEESEFHARAAFQVVSGHGTNFLVTAEGRAKPLGRFDATIEVHGNNGNYDERGVKTLDFGNGDTLSIYFEDEWVPDPSYPAGGYRVGPYVIIGGTGRLAGASGSGTFFGIPNGDLTGEFYLDGTISR